MSFSSSRVYFRFVPDFTAMSSCSGSSSVETVIDKMQRLTEETQPWNRMMGERRDEHERQSRKRLTFCMYTHSRSFSTQY